MLFRSMLARESGVYVGQRKCVCMLTRESACVCWPEKVRVYVGQRKCVCMLARENACVCWLEKVRVYVGQRKCVCMLARENITFIKYATLALT